MSDPTGYVALPDEDVTFEIVVRVVEIEIEELPPNDEAV